MAEKQDTASPADNRKTGSFGPAEIIDQVMQMVRTLREKQEEVARRRGITLLQYLAIQILRKDSDLTVTQLAAKLHLKHSTVSKLVDRMERDNLLVRVQSSDDRRAVKLRLTELALERVEGLSLSVVDFSRRLMGYLSPKEQGQLIMILAKLTNGFRKELARMSE